MLLRNYLTWLVFYITWLFFEWFELPEKTVSEKKNKEGNVSASVEPEITIESDYDNFTTNKMFKTRQ